MFPIQSYALPGVYSIPSAVTRLPQSAEDVEHDWSSPNAERITFLCLRCRMEIITGAEGKGALRLGGRTCAESYVRSVMDS